MPQPLPRYTATNTHHADQRKLNRIIDDTPTTHPTTSNAGGDWRALRGIPCIARSVGGTSPGTNPLAALLAKQPRQPK